MRTSFHGLITTRVKGCLRESGEMDALSLTLGTGVILLIWVAWYIMANFGKHNMEQSLIMLISDIVEGGDFRSSDRLTM